MTVNLPTVISNVVIRGRQIFTKATFAEHPLPEIVRGTSCREAAPDTTSLEFVADRDALFDCAVARHARAKSRGPGAESEVKRA
jgi:hypothetical protein